MTETDMKHLLYLDRVARADVRHVKTREQTYMGSWKKRGGVGAFMMMARKWDRLESMLGRHTGNPERWDVFGHMSHPLPLAASGADGTVLAEIRDLRQYLLLVEAEMVARGVVAVVGQEQEYVVEDNIHVNFNTPGTPEDGGHHDKFNDDHPVESGRVDRT